METVDPLSPDQHDEIVEEAVDLMAVDSAMAIAHIVEATDGQSRELVLQSVAGTVDPAWLSRLERRDIFLARRERQQRGARLRLEQLRHRLGVVAAERSE